MKKSLAISLAVILLSTSLIGCTNRQIGTAAGAGVGAGLGYAITGSGWGALGFGAAGGLIGYSVAR